LARVSRPSHRWRQARQYPWWPSQWQAASLDTPKAVFSGFARSPPHWNRS